MITHTYEEYPEIVKAAGQVLDSACARGEVTRMGEALDTISANLGKVETMLRGIRETFTSRPGTALDALTVEYVDAQLSMVQDTVCASFHLSDLTRGEVGTADDLPEFMQWVEGLACIKNLYDDHQKEVLHNDHQNQHSQVDGHPLAH